MEETGIIRKGQAIGLLLPRFEPGQSVEIFGAGKASPQGTSVTARLPRGDINVSTGYEAIRPFGTMPNLFARIKQVWTVAPSARGASHTSRPGRRRGEPRPQDADRQVDLADVIEAAFHIERHIGSRSILVEEHELAPSKDVRVLDWLVVPSLPKDYDTGALAEIEKRGADQVPTFR